MAALHPITPSTAGAISVERINLLDPFIEVSTLDAVLCCLEEGYARSPSKGDTVSAFCDDVDKGLAQAHVIREDGCLLAAFSTFFEEEKDGRALHVWSIGGEGLTHWLGAFLEYLEEVARVERCDSIKFGGRDGWERVLRNSGFKTESVIMRRAVK